MPLKQRNGCSLMSTHNIDIFGILESKLNAADLQKLMRIRFPGMHVVHNFDLSPKGRIFVIWNPAAVELSVLELNVQHVHARITCRKKGTVFCASFIYGLNKLVDRRSLWSNLISFGDNIGSPWILLGDFNNVLSPVEKRGGLPVRNYDVQDFADCVSHLNLHIFDPLVVS